MERAAFDGSWEKAERSPITAAVSAVALLGSLYYVIGNVASLTVSLGPIVGSICSGRGSGLDEALGLRNFTLAHYLEGLKSAYQTLKIPTLAITISCQYLIFLFGALILARRWHSSDVLGYMGYRKASLRDILLSLPCAVLVIPLVSGLGMVMDFLFPSLSKLGQLSAVLYQWNGPAEAAFIIFAVAITPAICEEAIFRGLLQRDLQRRIGFPWSMLASGCFFACFHLNYMGTLSLIPVGILLGLLYWATDSIWPGSVVHATYNLCVLLMANSGAGETQGQSRALLLGFLVIMAIATAVLTLICLHFARRAGRRKGYAALD